MADGDALPRRRDPARAIPGRSRATGSTVEGSIRPRPDSPVRRVPGADRGVGTLTARSMTVERPPADASHALEALRRRQPRRWRASCPSPRPGSPPASSIGLRDRVDRDLAAAFTTAGVSHVVAISGWNIAIVAAAIAAMAGRLRSTPAIDRHDGRDRRVRRVRRRVARRSCARGRWPASCSSRARAGRAGRAAAALGWAAVLLLARRPGADRRRRLPAVGAGDGRADRLGDAADRAGSSASGGAACRGWLAESLGVSLAAQAATLPIVLASFGRLAHPVAGRQPRGRPARRAGDGGRARRAARRRRGPRRRAAAGRERSSRHPAGSPAAHGRDRRRRRRRCRSRASPLPAPVAGSRAVATLVVIAGRPVRWRATPRHGAPSRRNRRSARSPRRGHASAPARPSTPSRGSRP